jgi:hypothetical protein
MLRAATLGIIDFAQFDPWDNWWWKRFRLILDEVGRKNNQEALNAQHQHWLALVAHSRLTEESWDSAKQSAGEALNGLLRGYFPWRAKEIGEAGIKSAREQAVASFHDLCGKPGEARYEQMVAELTSYFAKGKLSQREKELERKKLKEQAQLALAG